MAKIKEALKKFVQWVRIHRKKIMVFMWLIFLVGCGLIISNSNRILVGYSTYQKMEASNFTLEQFGAEVTKLRAQLVGLGNERDQLAGQLQNTNTELLLTDRQMVDLNKSLVNTKLTAEQQINAAKADYEAKTASFKQEYEAKGVALKKEYETKYGDMNERLNEYKDQLDALEKSYNNLVKNTATSICCKQKLDNPDIDYYTIKNDKITCTESSGTSLHCTFK